MPKNTQRKTNPRSLLPIPSFFDSKNVGKVWQVAYAERATQAREWAQKYRISNASADRVRVGLLLIDVQNTFCTEGFELVVQGATDDNIRLLRFIYENLAQITEMIPTLDTHQASQIFHPVFWSDEQSHPPAPMTQITLDEVKKGKWRANPHLALGVYQGDEQGLQSYALHYVQKLTKEGKYPLMIWP
ncbi:MAG: isochorismatase, partial [Planctomycetota bacterium]